MENPSANIIEYRSYWLSMSVVFTLKDISGLSIFVSGGSKEHKNVALNVVDVSILSYFENIEPYHSYLRGILNESPILSGVGCFVGRLISLFPMACMCLIWLNMNIFDWRLVLIIFLSMQEVITCALLHFTVSCWL